MVNGAIVLVTLLEPDGAGVALVTESSYIYTNKHFFKASIRTVIDIGNTQYFLVVIRHEIIYSKWMQSTAILGGLTRLRFIQNINTYVEIICVINDKSCIFNVQKFYMLKFLWQLFNILTHKQDIRRKKPVSKN